MAGIGIVGEVWNFKAVIGWSPRSSRSSNSSLVGCVQDLCRLCFVLVACSRVSRAAARAVQERRADLEAQLAALEERMPRVGVAPIDMVARCSTFR